MIKATPVRNRLLARIVSTPSGCWEWQGYRTPFGYGTISLPGKRTVYAHRASWEVFRGAVPSGTCVLHSCDNPPCINPSHLFLGSRIDNNKDAVTKGRDAISKGTSGLPIGWKRMESRNRCPKGHRYSKKNTYFRPGTRARGCRLCRNEAARQHNLRKYGRTWVR